MNTPGLAKRALLGLIKFQFALALLIFLPAWSLRFWEAGLYWILFTVCVLVITIHFLVHDPALIERRLAVGPTAETQRTQQRIQAIASLMVLALFVVAGLDHHLHWSPPVPTPVVLAADALVVLGFLFIFFAFRENSHASGVIEVSAGQVVVQTGPYRFVRHPMYSGALLLFVVTPVALASLWALVPAVALVLAVSARLLDEERYLTAHLPGYADYCGTVRYRLIPGIW